MSSRGGICCTCKKHARTLHDLECFHCWFVSNDQTPEEHFRNARSICDLCRELPKTTYYDIRKKFIPETPQSVKVRRSATRSTVVRSPVQFPGSIDKVATKRKATSVPSVLAPKKSALPGKGGSSSSPFVSTLSLVPSIIPSSASTKQTPRGCTPVSRREYSSVSHSLKQSGDNQQKTTTPSIPAQSDRVADRCLHSVTRGQAGGSGSTKTHRVSNPRTASDLHTTARPSPLTTAPGTGPSGPARTLVGYSVTPSLLRSIDSNKPSPGRTPVSDRQSVTLRSGDLRHKLKRAKSGTNSSNRSTTQNEASSPGVPDLSKRGPC